MKCAVMQPTYFPWLGYFDLINSVDSFVLYDDVQMEKSSWQLRNRIKTSQGELFISLCRKKNKGGNLQQIKDVKLNDQERWRRKHIKTLQASYGKAPYFDECFDFIHGLIVNDFCTLGEFNSNLIIKISEKIGIQTNFFISSVDLLDVSGIRDERLAGICRKLDCDTYVSPQGSSIYLESETPGGKIVQSNIELHYFNYEHPVYSQQGTGFIPYMSILDLLFNVGFDQSLAVIRQGHKKPFTCEEFRAIHLET